MKKFANEIIDLQKRFRRTVLIFSLVSLSLALVGLVGCFPGMRSLASMSPNYIPMAPSTALSFIVLTIIVILYIYWPTIGFVRFWSILGAGSILVFGFLKYFEYFMGAETSFEKAIVPISDKLGDIPIGLMSPLTGACFCLLGVAALLLISKNTVKKGVNRTGSIVGVLGILLTLCSVQVVLGYVHKQPFMYESGPIVPMALTTAIAFLFLSIAFIIVNGPDQIPNRLFVGNSTRARLFRVFIPLVIFIILAQDALPYITQSKVPAALYAGATIFLFSVLTSIIVLWVSAFIGKRIDKSEEEAKSLAKFPSENPNPVLRVARDGKVLYANDAGGEVLKSWNTALNKEVPHEWQELVRATLKASIPMMQETKVGNRLLSFSISPVNDADYVNLYVRDITARKKAEALSSERESNYRNLLQNIPGMTYRGNSDWSVRYVHHSKAVCGYEPEDFLSGRVSWLNDVIHPDDRKRIIKENVKIIKSDLSVIQEYKIISKDGSAVDIADHKTPFYSKEGVFQGIDGIAFNDTERKKAMEKIKHSEYKLSEAERIGNTGSWEYDVVSDTASWSENMFRIFDVDPAMPTELIFMHFVEDLVHLDDREHILTVFQDALIGKQKYDLEYRINKRDGSIVDIHALAEVIRDEQGRAIRMIGKVEDITERKKAEGKLQKAYIEIKATQAQLVQAEKMDAIGRMASGVAHEVKNPLGIILQGINYFESNTPSSEKDKRDMLQMMKNNIKRADNIIRALLDFSRNKELKMEPQDVNLRIESSLDLIGHQLKNRNIEVSNKLEEKLPKIVVDSGKVEQVFVNLFNNAIDAMPKGGTLSISSYLSAFAASKNYVLGKAGNVFSPGEKVVIVEVEDTGLSMDDVTIKNIFEPFFTTKSRAEGTGLGLSVVKNILDMHEALITVESEKGKGTKFTILFKLHKGA